MESFSPDHLEQETVNKATCRNPTANPLKLCAH